MTPPKNATGGIGIADLLGAILYCGNKSRKIKTRDDEGKVIESVDEYPVLQIEKREAGIICTLPAAELVDYMKEPHLMQFNIVGRQGCEDMAIITFEKQSAFGELLAANGSRAVSVNNLMSKFLAELNGLKTSDDQNQISNP